MHLLIVNAKEGAELPRPNLRLHSDWRVSNLDSFADLESPIKLAPPLDLIIAYQDRPKQLTQTVVLKLLSSRPLLRIIQVLGSWCDGDLRTPGRLAGVLTQSFREAELRLSELIEEFRQGKGPLARPLTSLESLPSKPLRQSPAMRVGVCLLGRLADGLSASLATLGHDPVLINGAAPATNSLDAIIIDGDADAEDEEVPLQRHAPVLRLKGFSRQEDHHTIAKLFSLADLDAALRRIMQKP